MINVSDYDSVTSGVGIIYGTERRKSISSIIKVIQFAEYIRFQLRRVTNNLLIRIMCFYVHLAV